MRLARVLDFETTGFPPGASVVEIGYTDVTLMGGNSVLHHPVSQLVRPNHPIDLGAMAVHHITPEMITPDLIDCALALKTLSQAKVDIWVAHKADFEQKFFNPLNTVWIDTLKIARRLFPNLQHHTVAHLLYALELYRDIDISLAHPLHRAGPDTYVTAHIFRKMLEKLSVQEMIDICTSNAVDPQFDLEKTCFLPKHKGKLWSDVAQEDIGYLTFIRGWADFDKKSERFKATIEYYLNQHVAKTKARFLTPPPSQNISASAITDSGENPPAPTDLDFDPLGR